MYGHVWRSIYKNDAFLDLTKKEWLEGLRKFDDQSMKHALLRCREQSGYPPNLPQFIELCKAQSKQWTYEKSTKEEKPRNQSVAYAHLNQLRVLLNMNTRTAEA